MNQPLYDTSVEKDERVQLLFHGTDAFVLSPAHIVQAAERDLKSKEYNARLRNRRRDEVAYPKGSDKRKMLGTARPYAFVAKHVAAADSVAKLLQVAIEDTGKGLNSTRVDTLRIYKDKGKLKAALMMASQ